MSATDIDATSGAARTLLHTGLPRTGTTTLQTHLFAGHSQVHYLGIFKGRIAWRGSDRSLFRDPLVAELMSELLFERAASPDLARCRDLWARICAQTPLARKVWSWEGLSTNVAAKRETRAENLARVLAPDAVLLTLRHPVTLIESTYFQILRRNNAAAHPGSAGTVWYEPIDEWLDRHWSGEIEPILDYARTVEIYQRHFGRDAVRVLLFEELAHDPAAFVSEVCRIAGIDEQEGIRRTAGRLENQASGRLVDAVRRARRLPLGSPLAKLAVKLDLIGWRRAAAHRPSPALAAAGRARIAEHSRAGNRRLSEELGLDLARHGYPM